MYNLLKELITDSLKITFTKMLSPVELYVLYSVPLCGCYIIWWACVYRYLYTVNVWALWMLMWLACADTY
jgi:hypothetical protein